MRLILETLFLISVTFPSPGNKRALPLIANRQSSIGNHQSAIGNVFSLPQATRSQTWRPGDDLSQLESYLDAQE
jgi:hypothetical protein